MGLNNVSFVLGQGGLGRPLPGQDYVSGLVFYTGTLPSGFSSTDRVKRFLSVADAEAAGILSGYADATAAVGKIEVTAAGANGNTLTIVVNEVAGPVQLGVYTKTAGEANADAVATAIIALINAGTPDHGYSAAVDGANTDTVAITAPKKLGTFLNSGTPLVGTLSAGATLAVTLTQFTGGVASLQAVWHYHISEFFRLQPRGVLWVGFFAVPGSYTYAAEVESMATASNGTIRQLGVYKDGTALAANAADLVALSAACAAQVAKHREMTAILGADISGTADLSTLYDMRQVNAPYASLVISQDGASLGAFLYKTVGKSITNLGAVLGAVALAKVSENIAWPERFNFSNGVELDVPAFGNGALLRDVSENLQDQLNDYRYIFLRTFVGVAGSYANDDHTATATSSDYAYINNVRTIQKATRSVYVRLVPAIASPVVVNADGTLADFVIEYFRTLAEAGLNPMVRDSELSAFEVVIDPSQNVLSTSQLVITINLVPVGSARNIVVNIGYNVNIA